MQFCIYCGAGVTPEATRKRTANPLTWRTCIRCGQTDELNQNFCIFCSGKIVVPGNEQPESNAYRKFSWELEQIDANKIMDKAESAPRQQPMKPRPKKKPKNNKAIGLMVLLGFLGALSGAGFAFLMGQAGLQRLVLQSTSWQGKDLIVYTSQPNATIMIENSKHQLFTVTQAGSDGALSIEAMATDTYTLYASAPGRATIKMNFPVQDGRTTVLGFPDRIYLPTPEEAAAKQAAARKAKRGS